MKFNNYDLVKIESLDKIDQISKDWKTILEKDGNTNVYADPDFFKDIFESRAKNSSPYIVLFKKDNQPNAIIIGWVSDSKIPLKLGYLKVKTPSLRILEIEIDCLITDGKESSKSVILSYFNHIKELKEVDLIYANHFSEKNIFFEDLKNGLGLRKNYIYHKGISWISQIRDKETGAEVKLHSTRTNAKLRGKDRKVSKYFNSELEVKEINSIEEIEYFVNKASEITEKSYHSGLQIGIENTSYWKNMLTTLAKSDYLRGYLLMNNDTPLAYAQGVVYKDSYYGFATSHNPIYKKLSLGTFLLRKINQILISQEINYVHYGYGNADYKKMFATHSHEEGIIKLYGNSFKAKTVSKMDLIITKLNESINQILIKYGIQKKIKKLWRSKLASI